MAKVSVVSDVVRVKMVEELLERFSAVVSDVCACFMGFKGLSGLFLEGKFNLGHKQLMTTKRSTQ